MIISPRRAKIGNKPQDLILQKDFNWAKVNCCFQPEGLHVCYRSNRSWKLGHVLELAFYQCTLSHGKFYFFTMKYGSNTKQIVLLVKHRIGQIYTIDIDELPKIVTSWANHQLTEKTKEECFRFELDSADVWQPNLLCSLWSVAEDFIIIIISKHRSTFLHLAESTLKINV